MSGKILIVDDDVAHLTMLETVLKSLGHKIKKATDGEYAISYAKETPFDLILMDVRMANIDGIEALKQIKKFNPAIPIIIMTAYSSVEKAVAAMKLGAYDYLIKPLNFEELKMVIERALGHMKLSIENQELRKKILSEYGFSTIIGTSNAMKKIVETAKIAASSEATILITGESGTGKELFAKAIHNNSLRKNNNLVTVNCAALSETLLESELFGHEKGAFTGAVKKRNGLFKQAEKGSIFLDEIGEIPLPMQAKLLRAIQEREIQRVGSDKTINVDVRIITATNKNLEQQVQNGGFRKDLYYRLNVVNIEIPPLRDRIGDIPLLAQNFLKKYSEKNRKKIKGFTPMSMDALSKFSWPGNVRELENCVERAVILTMGDYISEKDLLPAIIGNFQNFIRDNNDTDFGGKSLDDVEKIAIIATLKQTNNNKTQAARILNITRTTLNNKIKKFGIQELTNQ